MHIPASGPELQAVRFGYVILGKNVKQFAYKILAQRIAMIDNQNLRQHANNRDV